MALKDLLKHRFSKRNKKTEISKEEIKNNLSYYQKIIAYWRKYPDKFVDYLCSLNPDNQFKFYFSQRLYLRCAMRFRIFYAVFSRGFSKSFLAVLCLMLKCILYPRAKLATVADGKSRNRLAWSTVM